jgi:hypothetical protein
MVFTIAKYLLQLQIVENPANLDITARCGLPYGGANTPNVQCYAVLKKGRAQDGADVASGLGERRTQIGIIAFWRRPLA